MELTEAEVAHLLKMSGVAHALSVFNRVRSAQPGLTVEAAVDLQNRARTFDIIERKRRFPHTAVMGF